MADENTRQALSVMTAWAGGAGPQSAVEQIKAIVDEEGVEGLAGLTSGLVNLCGMLLMQREAEVHESPTETLESVWGGSWNRPSA